MAIMHGRTEIGNIGRGVRPEIVQAALVWNFSHFAQNIRAADRAARCNGGRGFEGSADDAEETHAINHELRRRSGSQRTPLRGAGCGRWR